MVEQSKRSLKRDRVAQSTRILLDYMRRIEKQLNSGCSPEVREKVDAAYQQIFQAITESLSQFVGGEGDGEEKAQLNRHIILIGML